MRCYYVKRAKLSSFSPGGSIFRVGNRRPLCGAPHVCLIFPDEGKHAESNSYPIDVVRDNRSNGGRVLPAQDGIEDTPEAATVKIRIATLNGNHQ